MSAAAHAVCIQDGRALHIAIGPLSARFVDGELRYIRIGGQEIVRRMFATLRDCEWGTIESEISRIETSGGADWHEIAFDADHNAGETGYSWRGRIHISWRGEQGMIDVSLSLEMEGVAQRTLQTNRTGLCVLLPPALIAGKEVAITASDGTTRRMRVPSLISADAIASDFTRMQIDVAEGLAVEIGLEGETFECEDQRNWADGSFKAYCRPLAKPFPYEIHAGERVWQRLNVHVSGLCSIADRQPSKAHQDEVSLQLGTPAAGSMPQLGLCDTRDLSAVQLAAARGANLAHLRSDLRLASSDWRRQLARSAGHSAALGVPLELAIHLHPDGSDGLEELIGEISLARLCVSRWLIYRDRCPMIAPDDIDIAARLIRNKMGVPTIGAGTMGSFAELNRASHFHASVDALAWPICPQVHSRDGDTLRESLEALGPAVDTARSLAPHAQLAVGPVWFGRRADPFAAGYQGMERLAAPDARLTTGLGAAWTLGCISALAQARADSMTLYEIAAPFGVLSEGAQPLPVFDLFHRIGEFAGAAVLPCVSNDPLRVTALAMQKAGQLRVMVASLSDSVIRVELPAPFTDQVIEFESPGVRYFDIDVKEMR